MFDIYFRKTVIYRPMRFRNIFARNEDDTKEVDEQPIEMDRIKGERGEKERISQQESAGKRALLVEFELEQLKKLCTDVVRRDPLHEYYEESETGKQIELPLYRHDYTYFIMRELTLSQIKDYALKNKIISPS